MSKPMSIRVVASVIERDGRLLVCERPAHKRHGGLWEFPGGKVEPDEDAFDAVHRELREELDVEVVSVGPMLFSMTDPGSSFLIEFHPVEIRGVPRCIEHTAIQWLRVEELSAIPLAPSDREFVRFRVAQHSTAGAAGRADDR